MMTTTKNRFVDVLLLFCCCCCCLWLRAKKASLVWSVPLISVSFGSYDSTGGEGIRRDSFCLRFFGNDDKMIFFINGGVWIDSEGGKIWWWWCRRWYLSSSFDVNDHRYIDAFLMFFPSWQTSVDWKFSDGVEWWQTFARDPPTTKIIIISSIR